MLYVYTCKLKVNISIQVISQSEKEEVLNLVFLSKCLFFRNKNHAIENV